jgi:putative flippase GtrA
MLSLDAMRRESDLNGEAPVDISEFIRFFVVGIVATLANLSTVWFSADVVDYRWALVLGVAAGFLVSFTGSKLFAFRSMGWADIVSECWRFVTVFCLGASLYWIVGVLLKGALYPDYLGKKSAELAGAFVGSSTMMVTSYLGHRYFTFQTHLKSGPFRRRQAPDPDRPR